MYITYTLGIFILSVIIMGLVLRYIRKREEMTCRGYIIGYLLVALVPFVLMFLITIISSLYYFDGVCYGFTDGSWDCAFGEYLAAELGYAMYYFMPAVGLAFVAITLSFVFHWFFARRGYFLGNQGDE